MHRACLIDAFGTTVRLPPPWERLPASAVAGIEPGRVRRAFEAEMSFYRDHAQEATDATSLAELRARCAELLSTGLGREIEAPTMMKSIAFEAYEDARPALGELRNLGLKVVCVSNWDYALGEVLERVGLAACFDAVVTSAGAGASKPEPAIFEQALALAGCAADEAIHVGDSDADVEGAAAAGIAVLRINRGGGGDITSLDEIVQHLRR